MLPDLTRTPQNTAELKPVKSRRTVPAILVVILICLLLIPLSRYASTAYTRWIVARAVAEGVFPTAEDAMRDLIESNYRDISRYDIFYAGPNEPHGVNPHVWYVIAEVHAEKRADGSTLGHNGCDAPGSFFMQTQEGWFHVPENLITWKVGQWMADYGLAGQGDPHPSTDTFHEQSYRMCQS